MPDQAGTGATDRNLMFSSLSDPPRPGTPEPDPPKPDTPDPTKCSDGIRAAIAERGTQWITELDNVEGKEVCYGDDQDGEDVAMCRAFFQRIYDPPAYFSFEMMPTEVQADCQLCSPEDVEAVKKILTDELVPKDVSIDGYNAYIAAKDAAEGAFWFTHFGTFLSRGKHLVEWQGGSVTSWHRTSDGLAPMFGFAEECTKYQATICPAVAVTTNFNDVTFEATGEVHSTTSAPTRDHDTLPCTPLSRPAALASACLTTPCSDCETGASSNGICVRAHRSSTVCARHRQRQTPTTIPSPT